MRKEYSIQDFPKDLFDSIDDFFTNSQIASLYSLKDSQTDRRVYHNISENLDLVFYHISDDLIYQNEYKSVILLVTTQYDSAVDPFLLPDVICNGLKDYMYGRMKTLVYYFPAPTLLYAVEGTTDKCKLIINFNTECSTFMLSLISEYEIDYENGDYIYPHRTSNMCFGMLEKTLDFDGGFFYGGDFMNTYEQIYREDANGNPVARYTYCVYDSSFNDINFHAYGGWVAHPYGTYTYSGYGVATHTDPNNVNRLDLVLRAEIDNAPFRKKDDVVEPAVGYFRNPPPQIIRNQTWATTMNLDYYVPMICSITTSEKGLPRYTPLFSEEYLDMGRAINMNNKMSAIMPLWFMVRRDPQELDDYSYAGKNNVINYVNMRYMDTDRMVESSFPSQENVNTYNCFQMGSRRSFFGMKGYGGLAFKVEIIEYDPDDPSTYPDWMTYPQDLDTCSVVNQHEGKDGYHFFPDEQEVRDADYALFVFNFKNGGVVYIKPDYTKMVNAVDNGQDYDIFSDAEVYVTGSNVLPLPPILPDNNAWVDISQVSALAGMEYHLTDYADINHMMFSGNARFDSEYINGEAYLCKDV